VNIRQSSAVLGKLKEEIEKGSSKGIFLWIIFGKQLGVQKSSEQKNRDGSSKDRKRMPPF